MLLMDKEKDSKKLINIDIDDDNGLNAQADDDSSNNFNSENSKLMPENRISLRNNKNNKKITRAVKDILTNNYTEFLSNFDPELSNREKRKLTRKFNTKGRTSGSVVDENGALSGLEKDLCDCLNADCPGCHFPCPKCRSCKCAIECRINRKWVYEEVENEAEITTVKNNNNLADQN